MGLHAIKSFCTAKGITTRRDSLQNGRKISARYLTESNIQNTFKNSAMQTPKGQVNPFSKWMCDLKRHISINKWKKGLTSLDIREMQIKTLLRFYLISVRIAIIFFKC